MPSLGFSWIIFIKPETEYLAHRTLNASIGLYGAIILSMTRNRSRRLPVIIVYDTSQNVKSTNRSECIRYWLGKRKVLTNNLMWTDMVVVFSIFVENPAEVAFNQDKDMIKALCANNQTTCVFVFF